MAIKRVLSSCFFFRDIHNIQREQETETRIHSKQWNNTETQKAEIAYRKQKLHFFPLFQPLPHSKPSLPPSSLSSTTPPSSHHHLYHPKPPYQPSSTKTTKKKTRNRTR